MYVYQVCPQQPELFTQDQVELENQIASVEPLLKKHLQELGFSEEMWSTLIVDSPTLSSILRWGGLPKTIKTTLPFDTTPPDEHLLKQFHPAVVSTFHRMFQYYKNAMYCFTRAESWWNGEPMFIVRDAQSFLMCCKYDLSLRNESVRDYAPKKRGRPRNETTTATPKEPKPLGRPRNEEAIKEKADKSARYQQWLQDCESYRDNLNNLELSIDDKELQINELKAEIRALKVKGAPKWIP